MWDLIQQLIHYPVDMEFWQAAWMVVISLGAGFLFGLRP